MSAVQSKDLSGPVLTSNQSILRCSSSSVCNFFGRGSRPSLISSLPEHPLRTVATCNCEKQQVEITEGVMVYTLLHFLVCGTLLPISSGLRAFSNGKASLRVLLRWRSGVHSSFHSCSQSILSFLGQRPPRRVEGLKAIHAALCASIWAR